jgi:hypothetical protein
MELEFVMKRVVRSSRVLMLSGMYAAVLSFGRAALAQGVHLVSPDTRVERVGIQSSEDSGSFFFEGFVHSPDGTPAEGAVVVSSAGGQAVTDAGGRFRLEVRSFLGAESVQITAVGRAGGNLVASRQVALPAVPGSVWAGALGLARGSTCSPSWLPTFGERPGMDNSVSALTVFDDGGGAALYAGGAFTTAGGVAASRIAQWDGSSWTALVSGMNSSVFALTAFDDGGGAALYAGGLFSTAGGVAALWIAQWDGSSWTALGSGMNDSVFALAEFDDGGGAALYAGGDFTTAGGAAASRIAKWDGSSWTALGSGMSSGVFALTEFDDGGGAALYAGGGFTSAIDSGDSFLAKWGCLDTTVPVLDCPASVVVIDSFSDGPGEIVAFSVSATDDLDPSPVVVCTPPSGSPFPPGTTLVTCTATDASGNQSECQFPVTVERKAKPKRL